jgi:hypothetical protein
MSEEYIARISYGKDSLKMLEVIKSRGLPLDRITTTDVWATDTLSANLPPMDAFKDRMDQWIWDTYRIEVEHLCARNPDGSKRTYEQMFYHIPQRRSQNVQVEREREREKRTGPARSSASRTYGTPGVKLDSNGMPRHRVQGTITGFPPNTGYNYCQKLKIVPTTGIPSADFSMVQKTQNRQGQNTGFPMSPPRRARTEISWNIWGSPRTSQSGLDN